jgi:hypothetical protein
VADIGLSIMDLKKLENCKGLFLDQTWYENESFANLTQQPSWRLIRKTPVENSFDKNWEEQQALIDPQTDEVLLTRQVIYTIILHRFATRERLFETRYVRTLDVDLSGYHIYVGYSVGNSFGIYNWGDLNRDGILGIASARKAANLEP